MKRLLLGLISYYQSKGGGDYFFGVDCNFTPSCSEYTKHAIEKYGAIKGVRLGYKRIRRCNEPDLIEKKFDPLT